MAKSLIILFGLIPFGQNPNQFQPFLRLCFSLQNFTQHTILSTKICPKQNFNAQVMHESISLDSQKISRWVFLLISRHCLPLESLYLRFFSIIKIAEKKNRGEVSSPFSRAYIGFERLDSFTDALQKYSWKSFDGKNLSKSDRELWTWPLTLP